MPEALFREDDLREMEKRSIDRVTEAIDAGDPQRAKELTQRMWNEFVAMHDLYRDWTAAILSAAGRRLDNDGLEEIMTESVRAWWGPVSAKLGDLDEPLAKRIRMFVAGLHGHLQPMDIEEDDEKVVIRMLPCGSGGRLVREGKYEGDDAFLTLEGPHFLTYGREDFPVYCAHEPSMEAIEIDERGRPFVVVEPAKDLKRDHCRFIIYKDPNDVPEKYYERLGKEKPAR